MTPTIVHATLAPDMHELEPTLTRYGYNAKALAELLTFVKPKSARFSTDSYHRGGRKNCTTNCWLLGIPLHDRATAAGHQSAAGEA